MTVVTPAVLIEETVLTLELEVFARDSSGERGSLCFEKVWVLKGELLWWTKDCEGGALKGWNNGSNGN
jgi:hypothetical protein